MPLGANKAAIMGVAGTAAAADVVLLHDTDYSNAATASITSGIDSTYGEYIFKFYNINPATDGTNFLFQVSTDGGSNYNMTITSTGFYAAHNESGAVSLTHEHDLDLGEGTAFQPIVLSLGNGADESYAGELHIFNPSSTTYAQHFLTTGNVYATSDYTQNVFVSGYVNTTTDIDAIQFKMASGNFDGTIKMWGVK